MSDATADLTIPAGLKPADGRFGCGPSKIRPEQLAALAGPGAGCWAPRTARPRSAPLVQRVRAGATALFALPDGYEVVLGNGGTTAFWDIAAFGLVDQPVAAPGRSASSPASSPRPRRPRRGWTSRP